MLRLVCCSFTTFITKGFNSQTHLSPFSLLSWWSCILYEVYRTMLELYFLSTTTNGRYAIVARSVTRIVVTVILKGKVKEKQHLFPNVGFWVNIIILVLWRNGSASDSRSEGCVFESRRDHEILFTHACS